MTIQTKLKALPKEPGVYFHKDARGKIIYVGKAARLNQRVRQYFQKSRVRDPKTDALVTEIADIDWVTVETELDALFLEAELIRRYQPKYNILLRDDKSLVYVRINIKSDNPTVTTTRRPLDDGAEYFGPYFSAQTVRRALKILRKVFPYSVHARPPKRVCLQYHLGLCPCIPASGGDVQAYRQDLRKLMRYLRGERTKLVVQIEKEMGLAAKAKDFEQAAKYRNQLQAIKGLAKQIVFSDRETLDISKDLGLVELAEVLGLFEGDSPSDPKRPHADDKQVANMPAKVSHADEAQGDPKHNKQGQGRVRTLRRIEGFDISHMSGTDNVASMVVFLSGVPDKASYRKFKMRLKGNDDFAHMNEVISRRLSEKNRKSWRVPDLFLIDGGKGQLAAAIRARDDAGQSMPMIGLAKREEEIIVSNDGSHVSPDPKLLHKHNAIMSESDNFTAILLPKNSHAVKLLQRIRDESHRFAVSYHTVLKRQRQTSSLLDDIPTIGPATRKKLLKTFGSVTGVKQARTAELEKAIGASKTKILRQYLRAD